MASKDVHILVLMTMMSPAWWTPYKIGQIKDFQVGFDIILPPDVSTKIRERSSEPAESGDAALLDLKRQEGAAEEECEVPRETRKGNE